MAAMFDTLGCMNDSDRDRYLWGFSEAPAYLCMCLYLCVYEYM